jgi:hypothetical protein
MLKRKVPSNGYIGIHKAMSGKQVDENIRKEYSIPDGAKIIKTFMYSDPPVKIYDCEVITGKKK